LIPLLMLIIDTMHSLIHWSNNGLTFKLVLVWYIGECSICLLTLFNPYIPTNINYHIVHLPKTGIKAPPPMPIVGKVGLHDATI
jgi:hypothetical protein